MTRIALVADDHEVSRMAFSAILTRRLAYERIVEAATFDEAMDVLSGNDQISLALIDLIMPGMSALASLGAIRDLYPALKVVIVSSSSARENIMLALAVGVHGYIVKDTGIEGIVKALELIEGGDIYVPPILSRPPEHMADWPLFGTARSGSLAAMTQRQNEVLRLLATGQSNKDIARSLHISEGTAKLHVATLLRMLNVKNRSAAAVLGSKLLEEAANLGNVTDQHHP